MLETSLGVIAYLITAVALVAITAKSLELYRRIKAGQPDPTRGNDKGKRFALMVREVLTHAKMLNFTGSGIAHWFVMIGFVSLFGTLITAYGQIFDPHFVLPLIGHFVPYNFFVELITWLTGISIVALIAIRQITRFTKKGRNSRFFGSGSWKAYFVEAVILAIVFCVIALRGLEGALLGDKAKSFEFALSQPAVNAFKDLDVAAIERWIVIVAALKIIISMTWFIEIGRAHV